MKDSRILIITGMSGAGKSQVIKTLEDLNYFCVDNLPQALIPKIAELYMQTGSSVTRVALVVDVRGGTDFKNLVSDLETLTKNGFNFELLFLDASDATLIKRYKESRRRHPLGGKGGLSEDIKRERAILAQAREKATYLIDTTTTTNAELRRKIVDLFGDEGKLPPINIVVQSFGFKHGMPLDCDMIFDVRFLPNPFYVPELKSLCGNDQPVIDFIEEKPVTREFVDKLTDLVDFLLPQYVHEGKSQLMIGIGCTGGHHRSVYIANVLTESIKKAGYGVQVIHRDLVKK